MRPTLQVLANQLAISISNAHAVKRLEEMATTDGLTGCLNKRAFLDEMSKRLRSAARFGRKLSLIVTDIDHFKSVNDTYGHATGDVVIKELGAILRRVKRETDVVARFGGEEFCVLCEETDTQGARLLAERIREELGKSVFHSELGKLSVTCSLGVATFPEHAGERRSSSSTRVTKRFTPRTRWTRSSPRRLVATAHVESPSGVEYDPFNDDEEDDDVTRLDAGGLGGQEVDLPFYPALARWGGFDILGRIAQVGYGRDLPRS